MIWWLVIELVDSNLNVNRPNFLLMIADDMGYGDVSSLGNYSLPTPNIDRIGNLGITLGHHLTAASVCTPSRSAFLTGRYPIRNGMTSSGENRVFLFVGSSGGLPETELTIAKQLKKHTNDYRTALIGKWHLGKDCHRLNDNCHHPNNHGFDHFFGIPLTNLKDFGDDGQSVILSFFPNFYFLLISISLLGITIGAILIVKYNKKLSTVSILIILFSIIIPSLAVIFQKNISILNGLLYRQDQIIEQPFRLKGITQRLIDEASDFIRNSTDANQPFLLILNFIKVHTAHAPSQKFEGKSKFGKYGDCVLELDDGVGQMLDLLEQLDILNNTFTYFSSDNGAHLEDVDLNGNAEGGSNGIFRGGKGHGAMEGGIRVPGFVMWPNQFPQNQIMSEPTMQMDVFTTIHSILNISIPDDRIIDGRNIFPLLSGAIENSPHDFMFHYCGTYLHGIRFIENSDNVWKIYFYTPLYKPNEDKCQFICMCYGNNVIKHDPPLIFNIKKDPSELFPIEDEKIREKILAKTNEALEKHKSSLINENNTIIESQFSFQNSIWKPWLQPCCSYNFCRC